MTALMAARRHCDRMAEVALAVCQEIGLSIGLNRVQTLDDIFIHSGILQIPSPAPIQSKIPADAI